MRKRVSAAYVVLATSMTLAGLWPQAPARGEPRGPAAIGSAERTSDPVEEYGRAMPASCRVARVDREGPATVRLYVAAAHKGHVQFIHAGAKQWFDVQPPGFGFAADVGDQVVSDHQQCVMTVTTEKGRLGVELRGPPGTYRDAWLRQPARIFVPAQS
jgi:hypothetical protein